LWNDDARVGGGLGRASPPGDSPGVGSVCQWSADVDCGRLVQRVKVGGRSGPSGKGTDSKPRLHCSGCEIGCCDSVNRPCRVHESLLGTVGSVFIQYEKICMTIQFDGKWCLAALISEHAHNCFLISANLQNFVLKSKISLDFITF
jgi:hypothetical protein